VFLVISVYFNLRNILPKSGTFLLGHPVYSRIMFNRRENIYRPKPKRNMAERVGATVKQQTLPWSMVIFSVRIFILCCLAFISQWKSHVCAWVGQHCHLRPSVLTF